MMVERVAASAAALDIQTGGGEVLAQVAEPPALLVATESRRQNLAVAKQNLKTVGRIGSRGPRRRRLPFRRRVLRPSRQQAPHGRCLGRDREGPPAWRKLPVATGGSWLGTRAHGFHDGTSARERGAARRKLSSRPRQPVWQWWTYVTRPCALFSTTSARSCTLCGRLSGSCPDSRSTAMGVGSLNYTNASRLRVRSSLTPSAS